jgi:hypothetical protein
MPNVTVEYMIMLPLLILQIFLFPITAAWLMNVWVDSRESLTLQDAASHLGSILQQLFFSLNHDTISVGTAAYAAQLPAFIENTYYTGTAIVKTVSEPFQNSSKVLELTLMLAGNNTSVKTSVVLGPNALWRNSTFVSNSANAYVGGEKFPNSTICLYFGG